MNELIELLNSYYFDPQLAEASIREYKELIWLALTLVSTLLVVYGIILPQRNAARQRQLQATLTLIDQWTLQGMSQALAEYQRQVEGDRMRNIASECKTRLCSFFHTVALLIREKKVEEALIRKSQVGIGFVSFYSVLKAEHPAMLECRSFYGREFGPLFRRWKSLAKRIQRGTAVVSPSLAKSGRKSGKSASSVSPSATAEPQLTGAGRHLHLVP